MDGEEKVKRFDLLKEFSSVISNLYKVDYNKAIIIASACIKKGYSLKYLREGIYKKSITNLLK